MHGNPCTTWCFPLADLSLWKNLTQEGNPFYLEGIQVGSRTKAKKCSLPYQGEKGEFLTTNFYCLVRQKDLLPSGKIPTFIFWGWLFHLPYSLLSFNWLFIFWQFIFPLVTQSCWFSFIFPYANTGLWKDFCCHPSGLGSREHLLSGIRKPVLPPLRMGVAPKIKNALLSCNRINVWWNWPPPCPTTLAGFVFSTGGITMKWWYLVYVKIPAVKAKNPNTLIMHIFQLLELWIKKYVNERFKHLLSTIA